LERKRLFDAAETDRLPAQSYTPEASAEVYAKVLHKARLTLAAGHAVIVDAVYATIEERAAIEGLAAAIGVPFLGLWLTAASDTLVARVAARRGDASDATPQVVERQLTWEVGALSPAWRLLDAGGAAPDVHRRAAAALSVGSAPAR